MPAALQPSDFVFKPADQFALGSLVLVSKDPVAKGTVPASMAVVVSTTTFGPSMPALFLLGDILSDKTPYPAGQFIAATTDEGLLKTEVAGIEAKPTIELDPAKAQFGVGVLRAIRLTSAGAVIDTASSGSGRQLLDLASWTIAPPGQGVLSGPYLTGCALSWYAPSGGVAVATL
jgi:hypothetical protein